MEGGHYTSSTCIGRLFQAHGQFKPCMSFQVLERVTVEIVVF
jgi:hypothetical protein